MSLTLVLGGIVAALLLGNLYIYLWRERDQPEVVGKTEPAAFTAAAAHAGARLPATPSAVQNTLKVLNTKYDFLTKKVRRLEELVVNHAGDPALGKLYNTPLMRKVDQLEAFRRSARRELEALKERLEELELKQLEAAPRPEREPDPMDEKIRKLVFNARR